MPRASLRYQLLRKVGRDVAVVDDRVLDAPGEGVDLGPGQVLGGEVAGLAGGRVVLGDGGRQPAGREVGVGLAQAERPPLGMALAAPPGRVLGQLEDVGVADGRVRPADGLGHGTGHGDDEGGEHERLGVGRGHGRLARVERRWLRIAPQALDAGDQITGRGPLVASSGQPSVSSDIPTPDDVRLTRTNAHRPPGLDSSEALKVRARSVSSSTFSGDTAMSMAAHPLGTDWVALPPGPPPEPPSLVEQAAAVRASRTTRTTERPRTALIGRSPPGPGSGGRRAGRRRAARCRRAGRRRRAPSTPPRSGRPGPGR